MLKATKLKSNSKEVKISFKMVVLEMSLKCGNARQRIVMAQKKNKSRKLKLQK